MGSRSLGRWAVVERQRRVGASVCMFEVLSAGRVCQGQHGWPGVLSAGRGSCWVWSCAWLLVVLAKAGVMGGA